MTMHKWEELGEAMWWCPACGTLNVGGYRTVGSTVAVTEEPPCVGWSWENVPEDFNEGIFNPVLVHSIKWYTPEQAYRGLDPTVVSDLRLELMINRRIQIFDVALYEMLNAPLTLSAPILLLPGMHVELRARSSSTGKDQPLRFGRLVWLRREMTPRACVQYVIDLSVAENHFWSIYKRSGYMRAAAQHMMEDGT